MSRGCGAAPSARLLLAGGAAYASSLPLAALIHVVNEAYADAPERAVALAGSALAALGALPVAAYLLARRRAADPSQLGLVALGSLGVLLVSIYLYGISHFVCFPADILIWAESPFVGDIAKFRIGHPLYGDPADFDSSIYPPASALVTYFLAWLAGVPTSIPAYRTIQVGFTLAAAGMATLCCRKLLRIADPAREIDLRWGFFWLPLLYLVATNTLTNEFVHNLHNDALAQLVGITGYWLLLDYAASRRRLALAGMCVVPVVGFFVKQSLLLWAALYAVELLIFDRPRSLARTTAFAAAVAAGLGASLAACYGLWGEAFFDWTFAVLAASGVSPLRAVQHLLDTGPYWAIGLAAAAILLRGTAFRALLGPWLLWLAMIASATYTSGIAWMLNHIGPASLVAGVWGVAALTRLLSGERRVSAATPGGAWLRAGAAVAAVALALNALSVVRLPTRRLSADADRYRREIEREFEGLPAERVLLDAGNWLYLRAGVAARDRVTAVGDRGYGGTADFGPLLLRLRERRYAKILVRRLHEPDFHYDSYLWPKSSGIQQTLLENYREVRRIAAVARTPRQYGSYFLGEISVLVPASE